VPGPTATIDRDQRDALYELVLNHLSAIGDLWIAVEDNELAKAEQLGIEFGEDLRLMHDLGWRGRRPQGRRPDDAAPRPDGTTQAAARRS
jgi:hypothetical protein